MVRGLKPGLYSYDGVKAIPVSSYPESAWRTLYGDGSSEGGDFTVWQAWRRVSYIYRAIGLRAAAVASMPYALLYRGQDVTDDPEYLPYHAMIGSLLWRLEGSLVVKAAAYGLIEPGVFTGEPTLRWVSSTGIEPKFDPMQGLTGFTRTLTKDLQRDLTVGQVMYCWLPDLEKDLGPGPAPAAVALRAAGVLDNLDTYLEGYFKRGAIKATILRIKGNPKEPIREQIKKTWQRMFLGVKNAHAVELFSDDVEPYAVGDALKETANPQLTKQSIESALVAMGVPFSLVMAGAANFATAEQDDEHFYTKTVIPDCMLLGESLNAQYFDLLDLELVFRPEMLEVMQRAELRKAEGLQKLAGKPLITVDEGRERLGLGPMAPVEPPPTPPMLPGMDPLAMLPGGGPPPPPQPGPPLLPAPEGEPPPFRSLPAAWPADLLGPIEDDDPDFWGEEEKTDFFISTRLRSSGPGRRRGG